MVGTATKLMAESGFVGAFYSGFVPILFKQVPYTMAKFAVQGNCAEMIYDAVGSDSKSMSGAGNIGVSLASGVVAGVVAAIISHPADTLLSKINKAGAGGTGSMMTRLGNIASEVGFYNLCTAGLGDDRHADRGAVRRLRHRHGHGRRQEVPLPRPVPLEGLELLAQHPQARPWGAAASA